MVNLKKCLLVALVALGTSFLSGGSDAAAQSENGAKNIIKANLFSPVVRTGSFFYERVVSEKNSFQLGFFYTGATIADETRVRGFGITPEYRFYLSQKPAPQGFYVAPFARYQNLALTDVELEFKGTLSSIGGGAVVGGQWLFNNRISLDLFGGPSYSTRNIKTDDGVSEDSFTLTGLGGFGIRFGLTLGVAF
jgi:hypothetical protein